MVNIWFSNFNVSPFYILQFKLVNLNELCYASQLQLQGIDQAFVPSIENKDLGNVFLPDNPRNLIKSGKLHNIPLITGITSNEGIAQIGSKLNSIKKSIGK